jgi:DNA-binding response OmpR family regulator
MRYVIEEVATLRTVLVVDDDASLHQLITAILQIVGDLHIESAYDGREALEKAKQIVPDLIVSDINMPDVDGLSLVHQIRETPALASIPVLLLTARGDTQDKYQGFLQGADDYLVKPFDATELQLRVKALLRRSPRAVAQAGAAAKPDSGVLTAGPLVLNSHRFLAQSGGHEIKLTASEFAIMRHLVEHPDQVVGVEAILNQALSYPPQMGNPQVIHTHIKNIRTKFRGAGVEPEFLTSSRQGYMLVTS